MRFNRMEYDDGTIHKYMTHYYLRIHSARLIHPKAWLVPTARHLPLPAKAQAEFYSLLRWGISRLLLRLHQPDNMHSELRFHCPLNKQNECSVRLRSCYNVCPIRITHLLKAEQPLAACCVPKNKQQKNNTTNKQRWWPAQRGRPKRHSSNIGAEAQLTIKVSRRLLELV